MDNNSLLWKDVKKELPVIDDEHEEGEIPYLVLFCEYENYDPELGDDDFSSLCIAYYYGDNHWKNSRWEKIIVRYWIEIPPAP